MKAITLLINILFFGTITGQSKQQDINHLIENGKYNQALYILDNDPSDSFKKLKFKGDNYYAMEYFEKAAFQYKKASEKEENKGILLRLGKTYEKLGHYKKALAVYQSSIKKDSTNQVIKFRLSKILLRYKRVNSALKNLKELTEKDTINPNYPYYLGIGYKLKKNYTSAITYFLKAFERDSMHLKNIIQLASQYDRYYKKDSTKIFIEKGLSIDPENKTLNRLKINQLRRDKKYQLAIDLLLEQEIIHENEFYNAKMLGICYFNLDALQHAKNWFDIAKDRNEKDFKTWTYLGDINVMNKNYHKAIVNYSQATHVGIISRDQEYLKLGLVFRELDNKSKAIEMFKQALNENWKNEKAHFELALTSESYYEDKKIAYNLYQSYLRNFEYKNEKVKLIFVRSRIKKIKEIYFLEGIMLK